jgi:hypothetical protein
MRNYIHAVINKIHKRQRRIKDVRPAVRRHYVKVTENKQEIHTIIHKNGVIEIRREY